MDLKPLIEMQQMPEDIIVISIQPLSDDQRNPDLYNIFRMLDWRKNLKDPEMPTLKEMIILQMDYIPEGFNFQFFEMFEEFWMDGSLGFDITMDERPLQFNPFVNDEICGFLTALIGLGKPIPKRFINYKWNYKVAKIMLKARVLAYQVSYTEYLGELKERGEVKMLVYFFVNHNYNQKCCSYVEAKKGEEAMFYHPAHKKPYKINLPDVGGVIKVICSYGEFEGEISEFWILEPLKGE